MSHNEVPGKKGTPVSASQLGATAENFDLFCHPCDEDHKRVEACGFCVACKDYLCADCVQYHRKLKITRNHVIQDKYSMPKNVKQIHQIKDVCTEPCTKHHGKVLEYYCEAHEEFGCSVCVTLRHISCGVGYIPELAEGVVNSDEYGQLLEDIDYLENTVKETKVNASISIADVKSKSETYNDKVNKLGEDLIKHIRDLMQEAVDEKDDIVKKMLTRLNKSREESVKIIDEIVSIQINLESKNKYDTETFILMKKLSLNIKKVKDACKERQIDSKSVVFQFAENPKLESLKEIKTFGTLIKYTKIEECLEDIDFSEQIPVIKSMEILSDGRLAIVDSKNYAVKLVDTKDNRFTETKLQHEPWDITEVRKGQLAVTLPNEGKIQLLNITYRTLQIQHLIKTCGCCYGIAACKNKLIVGMCYPSEVHIMDLSGRVMRTISNEDLFILPWYMAVKSTNNLIYVSDRDTVTVTCMTLEGEVKFAYSDEDMGTPHGLAIDTDGSVFVCGMCSVQHISEDGRKIQTLLTDQQEGGDSLSVAYDNNTGKIFLGDDYGHLLVYHLERCK